MVAVATLALAASANHEDAAYLANLAAGEVVRRLGVTTTSVADLRGLLRTSRAPAAAGSRGFFFLAARLASSLRQQVRRGCMHFSCSSTVRGGVFCKQIDW